MEFVLEEEERAAVQHICIKEPYILLRKVTIALGIQFISDFTLILGVSTLGLELRFYLKIAAHAQIEIGTSLYYTGARL